MNDLKNTYVYTELTNEDVEMLRKSKVDINKGLEESLYALKLNKPPLVEKLLKLVSSKKIRFVNDERLKHASVKWVVDKNMCLVNITPYVTKRKGIDTGYNIALNELYSLLLGAAVFLYSDKLNKDRGHIKNCLTLYMELIGKVIARTTKGHFNTPLESNKFHFIMCKYLLTHNKTGVSDIDTVAANISEISEKDLMSIKKRYNDKNWNKLDDLLSNVIIPEFPFMEGLKGVSLVHTISTLLGPSNVYMLENIDTITTIMVDHVMGGKPSLFTRYSGIRGTVKSNSYNIVIEILRES